jgi:hypothetical protein
MTETTIPIKPGNRIMWEQWQAGRALRRRLCELVAPPVIRREESSSDRRLREPFDGERGPEFPGRGKGGS